MIFADKALFNFELEIGGVRYEVKVALWERNLDAFTTKGFINSETNITLE